MHKEGDLIRIPLRNGLYGVAQIAKRGAQFTAVVVMDRESEEIPAADEKLEPLIGLVADLIVIEYFPPDGCSFETVGHREVVVQPMVDPLEIVDWNELPDIIYWRGCDGMGDLARQVRTEYEAEEPTSQEVTA
ncbi:MAG: hypothetical protein GY811_18980 [Myxococcales bacterium]|nr:hypothetical protein [Myxococcales bacterium]